MKQLFQIFSSCSYNTTGLLGITSEKKVNLKKLVIMLILFVSLVPTNVVSTNNIQVQVTSETRKYVQLGEEVKIIGTSAPLAKISIIIENSAGFTINSECKSSHNGKFNITITIPDNAMLGRYTAGLYIDGNLSKQQEIILTKLGVDSIFQELSQNIENLEKGIKLYFKKQGTNIPEQLRNQLSEATETKENAFKLWEGNRKIEAINQMNLTLEKFKEIIKVVQRTSKLPLEDLSKVSDNEFDYIRAEQFVNRINQTVSNLKEKGVTVEQAQGKLDQVIKTLEDARRLREQGKYDESRNKIVQAKQCYDETISEVNNISRPIQVELKEKYTEKLLNQTYILENVINEIRDNLSAREKLQARYALKKLAGAEEKIKSLQKRIETGEDISLTELINAQNRIDEAIEQFESPNIREKLRNPEANGSIIETQEKSDSNESILEDQNSEESTNTSTKSSEDTKSNSTETSLR